MIFRDGVPVMDQPYNSSVGRGSLHLNVGGAVPAADFPWTEAAPGNVTTLVNTSDGSVTAQYDYSPFGLTVSKTGPAAAANPYRFSTKPLDKPDLPEGSSLGEGLYYYGFRYYNPTLGRWSSMESQYNLAAPIFYIFLANSVSNEIDVKGLQPSFVFSAKKPALMTSPLPTLSSLGATSSDLLQRLTNCLTAFGKTLSPSTRSAITSCIANGKTGKDLMTCVFASMGSDALSSIADVLCCVSRTSIATDAITGEYPTTPRTVTNCEHKLCTCQFNALTSLLPIFIKWYECTTKHTKCVCEAEGQL